MAGATAGWGHTAPRGQEPWVCRGRGAAPQGIRWRRPPRAGAPWPPPLLPVLAGSPSLTSEAGFPPRGAGGSPQSCEDPGSWAGPSPSRGEPGARLLAQGASGGLGWAPQAPCGCSAWCPRLLGAGRPLPLPHPLPSPPGPRGSHQAGPRVPKGPVRRWSQCPREPALQGLGEKRAGGQEPGRGQGGGRGRERGRGASRPCCAWAAMASHPPRPTGAVSTTPATRTHTPPSPPGPGRCWSLGFPTTQQGTPHPSLFGAPGGRPRSGAQGIKSQMKSRSLSRVSVSHTPRGSHLRPKRSAVIGAAM